MTTGGAGSAWPHIGVCRNDRKEAGGKREGREGRGEMQSGWIITCMVSSIYSCALGPTQIPRDLLERMPLRARLMVFAALLAVARSACCPDLDSSVAIHGDMATWTSKDTAQASDAQEQEQGQKFRARSIHSGECS